MSRAGESDKREEVAWEMNAYTDTYAYEHSESMGMELFEQWTASAGVRRAYPHHSRAVLAPIILQGAYEPIDLVYNTPAQIETSH